MKKASKQSVTKPEQKEIIKTISSFLILRGEIYAAYLFGSFINDKLFADIDLGLLLEHQPDNLLDYEFELEIILEKKVKHPIDIRVLNNAPVSFVQNVLRKGKLIIDKDPNRRSDFESYSLRKYFDFAPFRRRYLSEVMNAPL